MRVLRSGHLWVALGLFAVFCLSARFIRVETVLLVTNSLQLAASTAVAFVYGPLAFKAIIDETSPRTQRILLGIFYSWFFGALWRIHSLIWLRGGTPEWFVNNDLIASYQAGITLAALYHLASPGAIGGQRGEQVPSLKWVAVGAVLGLGVFIALLLNLYNLDTRSFVEGLKPYIPR